MSAQTSNIIDMIMRAAKAAFTDEMRPSILSIRPWSVVPDASSSETELMSLLRMIAVPGMVFGD